MRKEKTTASGMKRLDIFNMFCRMILAGMFLYAGTVKLLDPAKFSHALAAVGLIPAQAINVLAIYLPAMELVFGACLLAAHGLRRAALLGVTALLMVFLATLGLLWIEGRSLDCSCFGGNSILEFGGLGGAVLRNCVLFAIGAYLYSYQRRSGTRHEVMGEMPRLRD